MEVAARAITPEMQELLRKVGSAKAFGTNARMISAAEAKAFPLLEEDLIEGAMWDPDRRPGNAALPEGRRGSGG